MDDVLEGVLQYAVKKLLKVLILTKKLFTLDEFKSRIQSFDFGYHNNTNKPCVILREKLTSQDNGLSSMIRFSFLVVYYGTIFLTVTEQNVSPEYKNIQMHVDNCRIIYCAVILTLHTC